MASRAPMARRRAVSMTLRISAQRRAGSAMQRDARHLRANWRKLDMIVGLAHALRNTGHISAAAFACAGQHFAPRRRVGMQRTMHAGMRLALGFRCRGPRGLLPLRRRHAGIVRRLRRQAKLGFKFSNTPRQHLDLPGQCGNRFRLRQNQADQCLLVERFKRCTIHP